ncbi:hypothetical protein [Furfurilactobacillus siliginis]|uniref:O-antigen polymerase n=1 Tax=Furfurilactobacillus siliginis TaxID=348151 RepID=A0A0R2L0U7_9LACO|nr:hypothetical protein [Furfurilactobacillus siliginis]KRN95315.1 hypothetical protein IV55_GL000302 [Furfurilactobacillus siliginis]GEK28287.1 hypothetical protein LSI01_05980 [Furfurilactobacillus siliginis]
MSGILIPISLFTRVFSYGLPGTVAELPFVALLILVLFEASQRTDSLSAPHISRGVVLYTLLVLFAQFIVIARSYAKYTDSIQGIGIVTSFVDIIGLVATFVLAYYAVSLTINSTASILTFVRSTLITLAIFELVVLIPQIIASMTPLLHGWVDFLAMMFEKRWHGRNFYVNGSYATTMGRINGFEAEAGYLAGQIGLVFIPLLVAGIGNHFVFFSNTKYNEKKQRYLLIGLFLVTLLVLFFAKTTTGFLVIGLSIMALFWKSNQHERKFLMKVAGVALVLAFIAYLLVSPVRHLLNDYLFKKSGTDNRLGGTIALFITFFQHPLLGVGNGWTGPYLVENAPEWSKSNWEFIYVYATGGYPILSIWGGWLAQFGLLLVVAPVVYIYKQLITTLKFKKLLLNTNNPTDSSKLYLLLSDAFEIYLAMFAFLAFFIFSWSEYYILISFFFYVVGLKILKKSIETVKTA